MSSAKTEGRAKGLASPRSPTVTVDWGTAYELVLGLRMLVDRDEDPASYAVGSSWFERIRETSPPALLEVVERYAGGHELLFGYLLALASEAPPPRDGAAFLAVLDSLPALELRRLLLGYRLETYRGDVSREVISAAADGDAKAARTLLDQCGDWQRPAYEHVLSLPADEAKSLLQEACAGWHELVLRPDEESVARALRRSARATAALAKRVSLEEILDTATQGIRYTPEPGIDRILLAPHVVSRPWTIFTEAGTTKVVCYGVAESQITGDAPPDPLVAAYKALGDGTRLRILRRLAEGPATLPELTELLGLAKSTVHGHLLVLRTGGLVTTDISKKSGYALRRQTLAESAALLETYLEGTEE
jgi:DNA-binding transcriptional ArsR family regulator